MGGQRASVPGPKVAVVEPSRDVSEGPIVLKTISPTAADVSEGMGFLKSASSPEANCLQ